MEIRGTLERILLEAEKREKMKKEKKIEVPTAPRGKQDTDMRSWLHHQEENRKIPRRAWKKRKEIEEIALSWGREGTLTKSWLK